MTKALFLKINELISQCYRGREFENRPASHWPIIGYMQLYIINTTFQLEIYTQT